MQFAPNTTLPAPSPDSIDELEEAYEIKLPPSFVRYLNTGNGGTPVENSFPQGGELRMIEFFLPLLDDPAEDERGWSDINVVITELDERLIDDEDAIGIPIIPFAALFGGDFVCLDFRANPEQPQVAVWDHELSEELQPHLEVIAPDFDTFLRQLRA